MREALSIAPREWAVFAPRDEMPDMKTIGEIRRDNLLELIEEHGSLAQLNELMGLARTDATLSQIKNRSLDSKTKKPRAMGDPLARRLEKACGREAGWMDNVHYARSARGARIEHALRVMEHMDDWQVDQAVKILTTIAEPAPKSKNGTDPTAL